MNKEHLAKLQEKVNRLMRASSEDSQSGNMIELDSHHKQFSFNKEAEPETVRKCIDLIKQNKELKVMLDKERNKINSLRKELQKQRNSNLQQRQARQQKLKGDQKLTQIQKQHIRKLGKVEAELDESKKRNALLQRLLINERRKNKMLCSFLNKNIPEIEHSIDRLTANLDAKMEAHFSQVLNI